MSLPPDPREGTHAVSGPSFLSVPFWRSCSARCLKTGFFWRGTRPSLSFSASLFLGCYHFSPSHLLKIDPIFHRQRQSGQDIAMLLFLNIVYWQVTAATYCNTALLCFDFLLLHMLLKPAPTWNVVQRSEPKVKHIHNSFHAALFQVPLNTDLVFTSRSFCQRKCRFISTSYIWIKMFVYNLRIRFTFIQTCFSSQHQHSSDSEVQKYKKLRNGMNMTLKLNIALNVLASDSGPHPP